MAADPRYRVFVIFVDMVFSTESGAVAPINDLDRIQQPLAGFLDRVLGPQDLFGFLTSRNSVKDLVLAQKSDGDPIADRGPVALFAHRQGRGGCARRLQLRQQADSIDACRAMIAVAEGAAPRRRRPTRRSTTR